MAANHLKFCAYGGASVTDLARRICETMSSLEFAERSYPMLTHWGMRDEDVLVHSLGCSVWNQLGQESGFMAVTECPAPKTHGADIRSDSTWFCRTQRSPVALVEFERFDGTERGQLKLDEKLCNLLEASMRWDNSPTILILAAWNKGVVSAPNKEKLVERCRNGFKSSSGALVPPIRTVAILFSRFLFEIESSGRLLLKQVRCERLL